MKLKILTPDKLVFEGNAESVTLPGRLGQFTVLQGHDILLSELARGRLYFRYEDADGKPRREDYDIGAGCAEITKNTAKVFVSSAEKAS